MRPFSVVREIRARIIPEILAFPKRVSQLRRMTQQANAAAAESDPDPQPSRRSLIRETALLAAKSLRAPIIDR